MGFPFGSAELTLGAKAHKFVQKGDMLGLQAMLLNDGTGTVEQRRNCLEEANRQGRTPLMVASIRGDYTMAKMLIQAGANVHHVSSKASSNGTSLHECVANGSEKIAQMLIDVGSNPFLEDLKGFTALDVAINRGDTQMVRFFDKQALFVGWLFLKSNRYQGLSKAWKPRWVTVFRRLSSGAQQGGRSGSSLQMHVYKGVQSSKPSATVRVDGACARMVLREAEGVALETLQCLVSLPVSAPAPAGIAVHGDSRVGWSFEVRPVCRLDASLETRQAAWGVVEDFCHTLNNPPVDPPPRRRATSDLSFVAHPAGLAPHQASGSNSSAIERHGRSTSMGAPAEAEGSDAAEAARLSSMSMPAAVDAGRTEEQTLGAMSDHELAMWLQDCYSRGGSTPRISQPTPMTPFSQYEQEGSGNSALPAAPGGEETEPLGNDADGVSGAVAGAQSIESEGPPGLPDDAPAPLGIVSGNSIPSAPPLPEAHDEGQVDAHHALGSFPGTAGAIDKSASGSAETSSRANLPADDTPQSESSDVHGAQPLYPAIISDYDLPDVPLGAPGSAPAVAQADGTAAHGRENGGDNALEDSLPSVPSEAPVAAALPSVPQHAPRVAQPPARIAVAAGASAPGPFQMFWDRKGKAPAPPQGEDSEQTCIICLDKPKVAGFVHGDSAHQCCCQSCAKKIMKQKNPRCPLCRAKIQHVIMKFYTS